MPKKSSSPASTLASKLRLDLSELGATARALELAPNSRRRLNSEIEKGITELDSLLAELDPIKRPTEMFDPGNPRTIGFFAALALTAQPRKPLGELEPVYGSGVYALYYKGDFALYAPISGTETPIYVGQAAPGNDHARTPVEQGARLAARLNEHRKNIERATSSLRIGDFEYRALVVQTGWETPAEDYLIRLFRPIWNKETKIVQGFGKHGDSPTTRQNKVSSWDVLHHGRTAAGIGVNPLQKTEAEIANQLTAHYNNSRIYQTNSDVLSGFLEALRQH
jgi:hypothetical protein